MVYQLISQGDYCGALLLLEFIEEPTLMEQYNKCYCLYHTSKVEETIPILQQLVSAVTDLTELNKSALEAIHLELIQKMEQPVPLVEELLQTPLYVLIHMKWLYVLALRKCNLYEKAEIIAKSLETYLTILTIVE
ncbi:MAG: hypothetical protein R3Y54_06150 [Eubacteriales bacterium]